MKNVIAVEVGDGNAEAAEAQFGGQQMTVQQQVGTVQRKAEPDSEQPRRHQGHPGSEVSMVSVDMFHLEGRQFVGQGGSEQSVAESAEMLAAASIAFLERGLQYRTEGAPIRTDAVHSLGQFLRR